MNLWLWETLRWTDVVDIALMSFIVYRALSLIRGTGAVQSLAGLVVLVGLYAIASQLDLMSIHWLLEKFFVYIVLAVIILFQQDIRRGLARAGSQLFLSAPSSAEALTLPVLEEVVRASYAMASRRMGALIAIEREASLAEFTESATLVDGAVSQPLLLSIFHPTSPLHDGAVVLRKGRVAAAQAFLPLSQSKTISRFMGTRHRAAIGLTEETDALVVVVSEERGTVGLVEHGQLSTTADAYELRERLQQILLKQPAAAPARRRGAPEAR
jgi:diadenylate cyclase